MPLKCRQQGSQSSSHITNLPEILCFYNKCFTICTPRKQCCLNYGVVWVALPTCKPNMFNPPLGLRLLVFTGKVTCVLICASCFLLPGLHIEGTDFPNCLRVQETMWETIFPQHCFLVCRDLKKQEAICNLHSGRKQLESTRNPETRANLHQKAHKRLTPRQSQPRKRFTKVCSDDDGIAKNDYVFSFPESVWPYNLDTNKKNRAANV